MCEARLEHTCCTVVYLVLHDLLLELGLRLADPRLATCLSKPLLQVVDSKHEVKVVLLQSLYNLVLLTQCTASTSSRQCRCRWLCYAQCRHSCHLIAANATEASSKRCHGITGMLVFGG